MPTLESKKSTKSTPRNLHRPVVYPTLESKVCAGETAITEELAKELLGWEQEDPKDKKNQFGNKHIPEVTKLFGGKIRCHNNVTNRPISQNILITLKQEILRRRWRFNGEPIIIGSTGLVLNGQHTLIGLLLAIQEWRDEPERHPEWNSQPTLDKLIVYGVSEDDTTVNTMDTCKPRSLSDVIYRAAYFKGLNYKAQLIVCDMLAWAIKMLWDRTGQHSNAFGVKRTHAESVAYLEAHPNLLKAVRHIHDENSGGQLAKYISPGYASAALFLMGSSGPKTKAADYYGADNPNDSLLDWEAWDRACEFFVELAAGGESLQAVRGAITKLLEESLDGKVSWKLRWAVLAKAWQAFRQKKPVTAKTVELKFEVKDEVHHLIDEPLGGIDIGDEALAEVVTANDPTKEEIKNGVEKIREKKFGRVPTAKRAGESWAAGDTAWVHAKEDTYFAELTGEPYKCTDGFMRVMVAAEEGDWEVEVHNLSLKQFEM